MSDIEDDDDNNDIDNNNDAMPQPPPQQTYTATEISKKNKAIKTIEKMNGNIKNFKVWVQQEYTKNEGEETDFKYSDYYDGETFTFPLGFAIMSDWMADHQWIQYKNNKPRTRRSSSSMGGFKSSLVELHRLNNSKIGDVVQGQLNDYVNPPPTRKQ